MANPPIDGNSAINILVLRAISLDQDAVAHLVACSKGKVVETESWFRAAEFEEVVDFANDEALKRVVKGQLAQEELTEEDLEKARQLSRVDVLRHYKHWVTNTPNPANSEKWQKHSSTSPRNGRSC